MVEYSGDIFEVQTLRPDQYESQWVIPKYINGEPKLKYVVSKSREIEEGKFFRKHQWICGCMDWRNRRQQQSPPLDRCKHIRAVIRKFDEDNSDYTIASNIYGNIKRIDAIDEQEHYSGYKPIIRFSSNYSGTNLMYTHILNIPQGSLAVTIQDNTGNDFCCGYIKGDSMYLGIRKIDLTNFSDKKFFKRLSETKMTANQSEQFQAMQEQYERWAAKQMEVINQSFVFDGDFSSDDKSNLEILKQTNMITDYQILGSSLVLDLKDKIIKMNKKIVWKGDYKIIIGKFPNFYAVGNNIQTNGKNDMYIHPHISATGTPCLASYGKKIAQALSKRQWIVFAGIVTDFLTQYNPKSPYVHL